ncbi:glycosyltransferase [Abyssibius alkaniclasticus]|uniref:MraY family glycosyltransferase n=1 Tax=Abyssibius alkaniclasticus TaxID=2881234 RepID=UPI0023640EDE|nr:glycosyltransferase [Abyssibius alkaniclasticus]UPH71145.1 glycosyltransferase [Abyssibius alkaniclasticus]
MNFFFESIEGIMVGAFVSLLASLILVVSKNLHGKFSLDTNLGVQKFHYHPTPRIGGVPLIIGYFATWLFLEGEARELFGFIGLAGLPAFAFGLAEDLTKKVRVRTRLMATIFSGVIFSLLTGYAITYVDVWGADALLAYSLVALGFTAIAMGGLANAINMIDGFHGLASGTVLFILASFALVGWRVEDFVLVNLSVLMAAIVLGFFVVNFPFGKLFLGDAGAYFCGFFVAALAVMLPARNPEVSPWVSLLILGYPATETLASIVRRQIDRHAHPGEPDSAHLHHLVHRTWAKTLAGFAAVPHSQNPVTSILMWSMPLLTLVAAASGVLDTASALIFLAGIAFLYGVSYIILKRRDLGPG